tara:strand:+ start:32017 stop:32700 length:684 start_codon:yes stop_codon:yes gene_type:complete
MPRNNSNKGKQLAKAVATNLPALPDRFPIAGTEVRPLQLYTVAKRHPEGSGPWNGEPDKLAWKDAASGLDCILLRQPSGVWGAFVAVSPSHPLWGFECDAIPSPLDLTGHGEIDYAETCAVYEPEETRICHVGAHRQSGARVPNDEHDHTGDAWWFGCSADKPGDYVPHSPQPILAREHGETYRDIDYMYEVAVDLAGQLAAIERRTPQSALNHNSFGASPARLDKS